MNTEQALINTLGFGVKEFIEKAIEGGWKPDIVIDNTEIKIDPRIETELRQSILLDPQAWKAVGKTEGWKWNCNICDANRSLCSHHRHDRYQANHHRFIDELYKLNK